MSERPGTSGRQVHEVLSRRDDYARQILAEIEAGNTSQRGVSRNLGIALGLTNLMIKTLVRKRWIRMVRTKSNRVAYRITSAGLMEKSRMSRNYFERTLRGYVETRDRLRGSLADVSRALTADAKGEKRVAFYGVGELAEIAYICLQETDLTLVGLFDERREKRFFGAPIWRPAELADREQRFEALVVMCFGQSDPISGQILSNGFPPSRVFWV